MYLCSHTRRDQPRKTRHEEATHSGLLILCYNQKHLVHAKLGRLLPFLPQLLGLPRPPKYSA